MPAGWEGNHRLSRKIASYRRDHDYDCLDLDQLWAQRLSSMAHGLPTPLPLTYNS